MLRSCDFIFILFPLLVRVKMLMRLKLERTTRLTVRSSIFHYFFAVEDPFDHPGISLNNTWFSVMYHD